MMLPKGSDCREEVAVSAADLSIAIIYFYFWFRFIDMPPSGDVVNHAVIPVLLPPRLSGRSVSLSGNAAEVCAASRRLFGKRQHVQTAQHFFLHEFADGNGNDAYLEEIARNGFYMQLVNQVGTVHADKIFPIQMLGYPRQRSGNKDGRHAVHVQRAIASGYASSGCAGIRHSF